MVRSSTDSGWSAATHVKAVQPRNVLLAMGQGLVCLEASIVTDVSRRVRHGVPGSQAAAGHPTDRIGTLRLRSGQALGGPYRLHAPTSREGKHGPWR